MNMRSWKLAEWLLAAGVAGTAVVVFIRREGAVEFFAALSAAYCWFWRGAGRVAGDLENILLEKFEQRFRARGAFSAVNSFGVSNMQAQIIAMISQALLKALQKAIPDLPADGATQINTLVSGFVGLVWDIAKLEGTKELAKLNPAELAKLFPQLASLIPTTTAA